MKRLKVQKKELLFTHLRRSQGRHGNELEVGVSEKLASKPEERFFEVVVGLRGDVVVLQVLLAMESDSLGLDFSVLDVNLEKI